ncbi:MAG: hypothetical protein QXV17_14805, partial [Candidatus Micrarchaeaceae archaeon]
MDKNIGIFDLADVIDRAIVMLTAGGEVDMPRLQKGIFLYLYSYAVAKGYDPGKVLDDAAYEPTEYGPVSDMVSGQAETLVGHGVIDMYRKGKNIIFSGPKEIKEEYLSHDNDEEKLLANVKGLVKALSPLELTFYIFYNPLIDGSIRKKFSPDIKIRELLVNNREKYITKLLKKG